MPDSTPTAQEVFNTVCDHLMKQGRKSTDTSVFASCKYRSTDPDTGETLKCAAGILIPDDVYSEEMEGKTWRHFTADPKWKARFAHFEPHANLIDALQLTHDMEDVGEWPFKLQYAARHRGLFLPTSVREKL